MRGAKANLADGYKAAKEVTTDLRWTQKRVRYGLAHFPSLWNDESDANDQNCMLMGAIS